MPVVWSAVAATLFPTATGVLGSLCPNDNLVTWYPTINKPKWTPPDWAFAPIWNCVSCGIGYASYLAYRDGGGFNGPARLPLILYGSTLVSNWLWIPIFFNYHNLKLAYYETYLTNITAMGCAYLCHKINPTAGYLFVPYILWISFTSALNYSMYKLNSNASGPKITELKEK